MDVKTRIRNAFLSEKNAESVFDQTLSEIETKCGGADLLSECYNENTLRNFQVSMMRYLWTICSPQLQRAHFASPKKTVFLLNALSLRRVVKAVLVKIKNRPIETVGLMRSFPESGLLPEVRQERFPANDRFGSVPIGYLSSPRCRTVPISKLDDEPQDLHVWWTRPDKRPLLEAKYADEIGFDLPAGHAPQERRETITPAAHIDIDIDCVLPWKYIRVASNLRTFGCPDGYTISVPEMMNLHRICLHKIDIPLQKLRRNDNVEVALKKFFFYFSEDDEPMHVIELCHQQPNKSVISLLQDEMNRVGRHAYSLVIDKSSQHLTITQIANTDSKNARFEVLLEQTKDNCADLLGFEKRNYQGSAVYTGTKPCHTDLSMCKTEDEEETGPDAGTVSMMIPQLSTQPIVKLSAEHGAGSRKQHEFPNYVLYENCDLTDPFSATSLSVAFYNTEHIAVGEHVLEFKCWYQPSSSNAPRVGEMDDATVMTEIEESEESEEIEPIEVGEEEVYHDGQDILSETSDAHKKSRPLQEHLGRPEHGDRHKSSLSNRTSKSTNKDENPPRNNAPASASIQNSAINANGSTRRRKLLPLTLNTSG